MLSPVAELLAATARAFKQLGVRWYLFGAQAVIVYGAPRLTSDADVTVMLGTRSVNDLIRGLDAEGIRLRVRDAADFIERTRVLPLVHDASSLPLDVVLAGPGLEERFLERVVQVSFEGIKVPVISPEDLVAVKILAGRPHDLQDAGSLIQIRGSALDQAIVRSTLELLEQALDRSDLVSQFEALVRAV